MVATAFSSISCCSVSILTSAAVTRCASAISRLASAFIESATCFSARPPISATMRSRSCRSLSKALVVCWSVIVVILQSLDFWLRMILSENRCSLFGIMRLAEATGYIILGTSIVRRRKHAGRFAVFDQLAEIHERGHLAMIKRAVDVLQGTVIAIEEIQVPDRNLFQQTFGAGRCVGDGRYREGCDAHDDFLGAGKRRAMM